MPTSQAVTMTVVSGATTLKNTKTYTGDGSQSRTISVPDSTTDQLVNITIDVSQIKSIYIASDKALTVETNSPTSPVDTITLVAGRAYVWDTDSYFTNLLATNVTAMYLTNASGATATFELELIEDATP